MDDKRDNIFEENENNIKNEEHIEETSKNTEDEMKETSDRESMKEEPYDHSIEQEIYNEPYMEDSKAKDKEFESYVDGIVQKEFEKRRKGNRLKSVSKFLLAIVLASSISIAGTSAYLKSNSGKSLLNQSSTDKGATTTTINTSDKPNVEKAVAQKSMQSVVGITTVGVSEDMFSTQKQTKGLGSGVIVSKEGYIFNGWWSRNDKENWVSVLEPNSAMEGQDTAYYARWTRKIDTYSDTTGVYLYSHFEGSLKKNTGTVVNNFGLIERNVSTVTTNYGEVGATETAISNNYGHVGTVEDKIISNNGVVDLVIDTASIRYNNNIVKDNQGILIYNNGKIEKNAGIITENNNYIGENTETVKFNAKGAEINVNKGIIRENKGVVYNYPGGIVKKNSGIVYNYGGMVSEDNTGSVIESYSVKAGKGIEKATLDNESFLDIDGAKWLEKTKGTATLTVVWAKGYNANGYHLEADGCKVTKNTNGTYTLSKITKNTTIFAAPTTFTITYKSENGSLQTTNPVTYTCETEDITLAAPSREGSTFLGWTGTDLAGTTKNVTIKKGSFGDRIYTAVWNNESQTVQQEIFILPKVLVKGKAIQKLSWNKIDEADGYFIYSSVSGKKMKKVFDTRKRASKKKAKKSSAKSTGAKTVTYTFKKRKSGTVYQYQIRAYKLVNGKKKVFCKSMVVYSVANNQSGKLTNVKNIKLKKKFYTLQVKQTAKIKAKYTAYKKNKKLYSRVKTFRYISSNTNVATVTKAGKIKAVKAGTCTIYVLAHNGVRKAVKVTVK